jgi:hypothetical protein
VFVKIAVIGWIPVTRYVGGVQVAVEVSFDEFETEAAVQIEVEPS